VFCWGLNDRGQVGPESAPEMTCSVVVLDVGPEDVPCQPTPTEVPGVENATALAANDMTSCAVLEDGNFTCWGETGFLDPTAPELEEGVDGIALGREALCAISRATGEIWCSSGDAPQFTHGALRGLDMALGYDGGPVYGCAIDADGRVDCWGRDDAGQRGLASFGSPLPETGDPPAIADGAEQVRVGQNHSCALLAGGTVACWGRNDQSQTGVPPSVSPRCAGMPCQPSATVVQGLPPTTDLASRDALTCALSEEAELYCWGGVDSGSPWRLPGPWEGGGNSCDGIDQAIASEILEVRQAEQAIASCVKDSDCVEVDLGVSCHSGCQSAAMYQNHADAMRLELARIDETYCSSAVELGCDFDPPACPPKPGKLACVNGACIRSDGDATGCEDACACKVLENLANEPPVVEQQCEGYHLMLHRFVPCTQCASSRLYFAIANYGQTAFDGEATVELSSDTGAALPEPMTVPLTLEPGAHSEPLYFEFSEASGAAVARLVVADNCDYMSEWSEAPFEVPGPAACPK